MFVFCFFLASISNELCSFWFHLALSVLCPCLPLSHLMGICFWVLSFVVWMRSGMVSFSGAVATSFMLVFQQNFALMNAIVSIVPGIEKFIIYLMAVVI